MLDSREKAIIAARAADEKKASDIIVLDVAERFYLADAFVICSGKTERQTKVIADEVTKEMRDAGAVETRSEGRGEASWILLDYGDVIVHIFTEEARRFYNLEGLWKDVERIEFAGGSETIPA